MTVRALIVEDEPLAQHYRTELLLATGAIDVVAAVSKVQDATLALDQQLGIDVAFVDDPEAIKGALARQACSPVRWVEVIRAMAAAGVSSVAECGPGKVLSGLTRRIDPGLESHAIVDPQSLAQTLEALQ